MLTVIDFSASRIFNSPASFLLIFHYFRLSSSSFSSAAPSSSLRNENPESYRLRDPHSSVAILNFNIDRVVLKLKTGENGTRSRLSKLRSLSIAHTAGGERGGEGESGRRRTEGGRGEERRGEEGRSSELNILNDFVDNSGNISLARLFKTTEVEGIPEINEITTFCSFQHCFR